MGNTSTKGTTTSTGADTTASAPTDTISASVAPTKGRYAVALLLTEPLRSEINGLRRATGGSLSRIEPHITLVPPINLRSEQIPQALVHLRQCATLVKSSLRLELGPIASFYPTNRVLYVAVSPNTELNELQTALNNGPFTRRNVPPEQANRASRPFVPHLTLNNRYQKASKTPGLVTTASARLTNQVDDQAIASAIYSLRHYGASASFKVLSLLGWNQETQVWETVADVPFGRRVVVGQGGLGLELTASTVIDPETQNWLSHLDPASTLQSTTIPSPTKLSNNAGHSVIVVTARRENQVVGLATIEYQGYLAWLKDLVVEPNLRRQGIGTALYRQAIYVAQTQGITRILPAPLLK